MALVQRRDRLPIACAGPIRRHRRRDQRHDPGQDRLGPDHDRPVTGIANLIVSDPRRRAAAGRRGVAAQRRGGNGPRDRMEGSWSSRSAKPPSSRARRPSRRSVATAGALERTPGARLRQLRRRAAAGGPAGGRHPRADGIEGDDFWTVNAGGRMVTGCAGVVYPDGACVVSGPSTPVGAASLRSQPQSGVSPASAASVVGAVAVPPLRHPWAYRDAGFENGYSTNALACRLAVQRPLGGPGGAAAGVAETRGMDDERRAVRGLQRRRSRRDGGARRLSRCWAAATWISAR